MFINDFFIEDKLISIIVQHFSCVFMFTMVEPLAVNEFTDLCDELASPFE